MRRSTALIALLGAAWMMLVIYEGWVLLALTTNYPGMFAARFIQYRGIAPSSTTVWMFNAWLVLTSALEWAVIGSLVRRMAEYLRTRG